MRLDWKMRHEALAALGELLVDGCRPSYLLRQISEYIEHLEALEAALPDDDSRCSKHEDAPHGFDRDASHNEGRYVCTCESWQPPSQGGNEEKA